MVVSAGEPLLIDLKQAMFNAAFLQSGRYDSHHVSGVVGLAVILPCLILSAFHHGSTVI